MLVRILLLALCVQMGWVHVASAQSTEPEAGAAPAAEIALELDAPASPAVAEDSVEAPETSTTLVPTRRSDAPEADGVVPTRRANGGTAALQPDALRVDSEPPPSYFDTRRFRRNRRVSISGKVLSAVGPVITIVGVLLLPVFDGTVAEVTRAGTLMGLGMTTGLLGRLMWTGADMRMTKRLREEGADIRRGAAITALVFASISWLPYASIGAIPATWIAGGVASSRLPTLYGRTSELAAPAVLPGQGIGRFSASFRLRF